MRIGEIPFRSGEGGEMGSDHIWMTSEAADPVVEVVDGDEENVGAIVDGVEEGQDRGMVASGMSRSYFAEGLSLVSLADSLSLADYCEFFGTRSVGGAIRGKRTPVVLAGGVFFRHDP
ncbi:MAG: hypothetical protein WD342_05300, partial [Verrucomicrobiales bacterium]